MTLSQEILLILLSKSLFARTPEFVDGDWLEVLKEAKNQAVVQLAAQELDYTRLSIEESQAWEKAASADLANSCILRRPAVADALPAVGRCASGRAPVRPSRQL